MKLPEIESTNDQVTMINAFLGLNENLRIADNEFSDMKNITNDYYPAIGNRKKRGIIRTLTKPMGILGGKYLSYVDDNKFYFDESYICDLEDTGKERQLVSMGAYIVIFPDGIIYNTNSKEISYIKNTVTTESAPVFTLCKLDGTNFTDDNCVTSDTEPSDKTKYWLDTSSDPVVLKVYSTNSSMWASVGTTYVKVSATGIGEGFSEYDAATFSGVDTGIPQIYNDYDFNQSNLIYACGEDYLIIAGLINKIFTNSQNITVKRELPDMDYVCELDNRIWGCSSDNHEIYACKLGDPKNWYCYAGLDSDSYAATVGTQTDFTGCISFLGYVFFFKDDGYHKMYGTKPSNFEMVWKPGRGVQNGSEKSLCRINDYLIYKAREGVCLFDGSTEVISGNLGPEAYYDAVAGSYRNKYYVSMRDEDYTYRIYVYDTVKGTWCIEDNMRLKYLTYANGGMYVIDNENCLYCINEEKIYTKYFPEESLLAEDTLYPGNYVNGESESDFEWMLETGDIGMDSPYEKYLKRLDIRLTIDQNAWFKIEISYDSAEDWDEIMTYFCTKKRSYSIPIPVKRCDHVKLRISGKGEIKIYSIAKVMEDGSDV